MVDIDPFLTILYVMVDDFDKACLPPERRPGPPAALSRSEVLTLALMGQWQPFASERAFYRYVQRPFATSGRGAFPTLPDRAQFNRLVRRHPTALVACFRSLVEMLDAHASIPQHCPFELLDATPSFVTSGPTRDAKRRGHGWLPGLADIGWSNRLGGYEGFHGLMAVNPVGVITGLGFRAASTQDPPLAETFFAARHCPPPGLLSPEVAKGGTPTEGPYLTDIRRAGLSSALRERRGERTMEQPSSVPPRATAATPGRAPGGGGWRACARSSKRSMAACITPFASTASVPMPSMASRRAWPPLCQ